MNFFKMFNVDARIVKTIFKCALSGGKEYHIDLVYFWVDLLKNLLENLSFLFVITIIVNKLNYSKVIRRTIFLNVLTIAS